MRARTFTLMSSNFTDPPDSIYDPAEDDSVARVEGAPMPADLRDDIPGPDDLLRPAVPVDDPVVQDVRADGGLDRPLPEEQRAWSAVAPGTPQVTRDTTLSRAVDAEAAGVAPESMGMSSESEIGHPGPLAPDASEQPAAAEGEPAGKWGSSGAPTN
jgi:hypothetical protein